MNGVNIRHAKPKTTISIRDEDGNHINGQIYSDM